jgi:hypothetical protein
LLGGGVKLRVEGVNIKDIWLRILTLIGDVIAKRAKRCQRSNEHNDRGLRYVCWVVVVGGVKFLNLFFDTFYLD